MTDPNPPVEERFIPTLEQLKELWMKHNPTTSGMYANYPEKHEFELGWQEFFKRLSEQVTLETIHSLTFAFEHVLNAQTETLFDGATVATKQSIERLHEQVIDVFKAAIMNVGTGIEEP